MDSHGLDVGAGSVQQQGSQFLGSNYNNETSVMAGNIFAHTVNIGRQGNTSTARNDPIFSIPLARNPSFVGRCEVIAEIQEVFQNHQRVAIHGMGGVGKSEVANEYCYRFQEENPDTNVFWMDASTRENLVQGYHHLAGLLGISLVEGRKVDILRLVAERLDDGSHGDWLLVMDSADDRKVFWPETASGIQYHLPVTRNCLIMLTTRHQVVATQLCHHNAIKVTCPPRNEAMMILVNGLPVVERRRAAQGSSSSDVDALLEAFGDLPLAIAQATGYITNNFVSLDKYVKMITTSTIEEQGLLDCDGVDGVMVAFRLSFQRAAETPLVQSLLALMALLDRQRIPRALLRDLGDKTELESQFGAAIGKLLSLSIIVAENNGETFTMHRLVQLAAQNWLRWCKADLAAHHETAVQRLASAFPEAKYENWGECRPLLPHAKAVLQYEKSTSPAYAKLMHNVACYQLQQEQFEDAEQYARRAHQIRVNILHPNDGGADASESLELLACVLTSRGKYPEAREKQQDVIEWKTRRLGPNDPNTLGSVNSLGSILREQRMYTAAVSMHRKALEGRILFVEREGLVPDEDPTALGIMADLGVVLADLNNLDEAEKWHRRALKGKSRRFGKEHPMTLTSMENLAGVLVDQNKLSDSRELYEEVLREYTNILGICHSDTISCLSNLAFVLTKEEKYGEAEKLYRDVGPKYERIFGPMHNYTLTSYSNLSRVLFLQKDYVAAAECCKKLFTTAKAYYGQNNPQTLTYRRRLALTFQAQRLYRDAQQIYEEILPLWESRHEQYQGEMRECIEGLVQVLSDQESSNLQTLVGRGTSKDSTADTG